MNMNIFNGHWVSHYTYQTSDTSSPNSSEHIIIFESEGENIVGKSLPQDDGSQLTLRLRYNEKDQILTGTWQEKTAPNGAYKGTLFHGALQLLLNETNTIAEGKWVGFNSSRTKVKTGEWRLHKH